MLSKLHSRPVFLGKEMKHAVFSCIKTNFHCNIQIVEDLCRLASILFEAFCFCSGARNIYFVSWLRIMYGGEIKQWLIQGCAAVCSHRGRISTCPHPRGAYNLKSSAGYVQRICIREIRGSMEIQSHISACRLSRASSRANTNPL